MGVQVAVVGATGRLGQVVCQVVADQDGFELAHRLGSHSNLDELQGADLVIDVTVPGVSETVVSHALHHGARVLVGTSGWDQAKIRELESRLDEAAGATVMIVPNFSLGSTLATQLARIAARHFQSVEIIEAHHQDKVDSPSGTAKRTAELIAAERLERGGVIAQHTNQVARGEAIEGVPVHSLRLSGVIARQEVIFGGQSETLSISHETLSADSYRSGIALAMSWVMQKDGLTVGLEQALGLDGLG